MQILGEAIEREPESRDGWVDTVCAGDEALRAEVARLLARQKPADRFLEESPLAIAAEFDGRPMVGQHIGVFKIISEIGRGGMGAVYLAERDDQQFAKRVAVKLIKRGMDTDFVVQRFRNERQILANLDHPNIARLFDGGATEADLPYFVMEYVDGEPIIKYANANQLTTTERLKLFCTVCSAVQYAHQNLVIHRDLKPSNILVTKDGEPKLLDFGIAKLVQADGDAETELTATAVRVMTPEYASPEQVKGERITTSSDVYSLGVLLYELLTGCRPYRVKSRQPEEIANAICEQQPEKPSQAVSGQWSVVSESEPPAVVGRPKSHSFKRPTTAGGSDLKLLRGDLDNIVLKALRKEPARRYLSVEQLSEDIRRHLEGLPVIARQATLSYRASKFIHRNKIGVAAATIILLTLIGGIIATAWEARIARIESARAQQRFDQVRKLAHSVLFDYHDQIAALPGSTKVREGLVKDSLEYLDNLSQEAGSNRSLMRELAGAYLKIGDVQGRPYASNLGRTDDALVSYQKSLAILESLSSNYKKDNEISRELATVYERIGNIQLRKGDWKDALNWNNKALVMRQTLLSSDPSNRNFRREVADSYLYVGDALQAPCGELKCENEALEDQLHTLELREALAREDPSDPEIRRGIAQAHTRVGFRFNKIAQESRDKKYLQQWLEQDQASLAIRKELAAANPTNAVDRRNLADQLMLTANAQLENGDNAGALAGYHQSLDVFKTLSAADASNTEALRDLSFICFRLAVACLRVGDMRAARENYERVLEVDRRLLSEDPNNEEDLATVGAVYRELSRQSEKEGNLGGAITNWKHHIDSLERIVAIAPNNTSRASECASAYQVLGVLHARNAGAQFTGSTLPAKAPLKIDARQAKEWREARAAYQKALNILEDMKGKGTLEAAHAGWPDGLANEIAKCDAALQK
jgi:serine/threonine protein kinase